MRTLIALICLLTASLRLGAQDAEGFIEVKKEGDIVIYERWITFPKSNPPVKAREVKGEFFFKNDVYAGLHLLQDPKQIKEWQSHVSEFEVYRQKDTTVWYEYSYHDIPWPVSDQDHFLIYKLKELIPGEDLFITFESLVDKKLAPIRKNVTRMELSGSWRLQKIAPNKVKATYRILSTPLNIPKILTDPIIRNNLMTTIEEYIEILERKKKS